MIGQASWVGLWESAGEAAKVGRGQLDRPFRGGGSKHRLILGPFWPDLFVGEKCGKLNRWPDLWMGWAMGWFDGEGEDDVCLCRKNINAAFWNCGADVITVIAAIPHVKTMPDDKKSLKERLTDPAAAAAFIRNGIPADLAAMIRWDQLRLVPGSFTDEKLKHLETDLLFAAPFAENEAFLYLYFDLDPEGRREVIGRVRRCMAGISAAWVATHGNSRPQPVIVPAIVPVFVD